MYLKYKRKLSVSILEFARVFGDSCMVLQIPENFVRGATAFLSMICFHLLFAQSAFVVVVEFSSCSTPWWIRAVDLVFFAILCSFIITTIIIATIVSLRYSYIFSAIFNLRSPARIIPICRIQKVMIPLTEASVDQNITWWIHVETYCRCQRCGKHRREIS